jgi:hypothetical protein
MMVARRLPEVSLGLMAHDNEAEVRRIVAERMSGEDVVVMLGDKDWLVRYTAVQKASLEAIASLSDDPEPDVRAIVHDRLKANVQG